MASEAKPDTAVTETENLLHDNNLLTKKKHDVRNENQLDTTGTEEKETFKLVLEENNILGLENDTDKYTTNRCRKTKKYINLSLLAFRISQCLWFAAGSLPGLFLGIFLKKRGLTIVQISSVFSMIFIFQFIGCSITGVIADKMGNAKPVLLFLMLATSSVLASMLLTPNINSASCIHQEIKLSHPDTSAGFKNVNNSCYINCLLNKKNHKSGEKNITEYKRYENVSIEINSLKNVCDISEIPSANGSFDSAEENCCNRCAYNSTDNCIKARKEYLVPVYGFLILAFYAVWNTAYRFMNLVSLSLASKNDSYLGKEMAIAYCGNFLVMLVVAFILNIDKSSESGIDFDPLIGIAAGIMFFAFVALSMTSVPILPPGKNLLKKSSILVRDVDLLAFILLIFVAGNAFAFNFTFHMVFLDSINASSVVVSVHSVGLPLYTILALLTTKWWLKMVGINRIFVLGLMCYSVNDVALSYIYNPWWSLIFDVVLAFGYSLLWTAAVIHCQNVAPVGFGATLNALAGAVHYGVGRSSGVFFGGMMMNYMGIRIAFRIMAAIFFGAAILYSVFIHSRIKSPKITQKINGTEIKEAKESENADKHDARLV